MKSPFFSVIIPVYNRKELLLDAVKSVLCQTYTFFEIIIGDDGSQDGSAEGALDLLHNSVSVSYRILSLEHSGFPGAVRNRAVEAAKGNWLVFLDSDDLWMPDKLEKQAEYIINHPDCRLLHTRERWLRNGREISQKKLKHQRAGDIFSDALIKCIIGPSTTAVETDFFRKERGFREDLEIAEDYELWLRLLDKTDAGYIDIPLIEKRAGLAEQLSEKYGQIEIFRIKALKDLVEKNVFTGKHQNLAKSELIRKLEIYINGCIKRGKAEEAERYKAELNGFSGS